MNQRMPYQMPQGRYMQLGGGPHDRGADTLEWVIFALLLVLILLVIAQIALMLTRRARFGGRQHKHYAHYAVPGPPGPPGGMPWGRPDPVAVARMRYARGEIGRDEYVQLTQDLGGEPEVEPLTPPA